jgi:hypothetical protein
MNMILTKPARQLFTVLMIILILLGGSIGLGIWGFKKIIDTQKQLLIQKQATADVVAQTQQAQVELKKKNPKLRVPKPPPIPEPLRGGQPLPESAITLIPGPTSAAEKEDRHHRRRAKPTPKPTWYEKFFLPKYRNDPHATR